MSGKIIKKIGRILSYFIGALLLLCTGFYFAFRNSAFQTWAVHRVGWYFSERWGTTVRVEGVDIEFWKKVVLEGVYIEDQKKDTLLYAEKLKFDIGTFDRDSQHVFISDIILHNATVKLKQYKGDSALNFQFIIDEFSSHDTAAVSAPSKWTVGIGGITLDNICFTYKVEKQSPPSPCLRRQAQRGESESASRANSPPSGEAEGAAINFSDIFAHSVHGKISDISFDADTIHGAVESFSLREKSGFLLKKFSTKASISPVLLKLDKLKIFTNNSQVVTNLSFKYKTWNDFNHFIDNIKMKSQFNSSNVEMEDVAYFFQELEGLKKRVFLNGEVIGKVSELKGRNIFLTIGDETSFRGDFDMTGLPDINQTFMSFNAKELRTSKKGIEDIPLPPFHEQHSISLPENSSLFGVIKFKGNFTGFYNDFVSYGKFNTALGQIFTDISLKEDTLSGLPVYRGKFACTDFNLGKFFESEKQAGKISMNVSVDGRGLKKENAVTSMEGQVSSLELNGYTYQHIDLKGKLAKNIFDGRLAVRDAHLHLDFNGNMDFSKSPTLVNFTADITKADLSKLNFIKSDEYVGITAKMEVNVIGNNLDDVTGKMKLNDVVYLQGTEVFDFKDLVLNIEEEEGIKTMDFNSSFADAHLNGKFKPLEAASCLNDFLSNYLPSYIPRFEGPVMADKKSAKYRTFAEHLQKFSFDVQIKNTDVVTRALVPSLNIAAPASMRGNYDEGKNDFYFTGDFPAVSVQKYTFKNCKVTASSEGNMLSFKTNCRRLVLSDSVWIDNIRLASAIAYDTVNFKLNWRNSGNQKYEGDIPGYIAFSEKPKIKLKFLPSIITIADSSWQINKDNEAWMFTTANPSSGGDSSFIRVKNFDFVCGNQRVKLNGNFSGIKDDPMVLTLASFSLENLNPFLKGSGFALYGTISGNTSIGNIYVQPLFRSDIDIKNMKVNKEMIGNGTLVSVYDSRNDMINFNGGFKRDEGENLKFAGNYYPSRKENSLEMDAEVHDFRLDFFEPFVKVNFENIKGLASAKIKINGTPDKPLLTGIVKTKVDNVHVNYLGTDYHFEGDIGVEPNSFDVANLMLYDANQNSADVVNGKIFHTDFKNFQLDIDINATKFLCLNTTEKDNSIYYGKVFATGILNVFGFFDNINLSANVKTDKARNPLGKNEYSQLFIPLSGSEEVGENGFISYVKNDTAAKEKPKYNVSAAGFTMDFNLQPTSDAQVQLIFDEKVGDIIKANGTGDIRMVIDKFGNFKMYGDYNVEEGDYLFTLKNVVNKKFRMEKGGAIHWSGNPEEADLKMSAVYELRTSLSPLFLFHEQTELIKKRYPVDCIMNLSGRLLEPDISFDIKLPTTDEITRQQAYDKFKHNENSMNQQVFSLLFTNNFTSPPDQQSQLSSEAGKAGTAGTMIASTEILSNQLSNWLSQISNKFDVGVHYRPAVDSVSFSEVELRNEVELALSTQLFNNKMSIDGTVGNNSNVNNLNANNQKYSGVVGDITIEYKLTEDGKFRAKAYNKANEGDISNTEKGPWTQGLGIFYREEFETLGELYRRFLGKTKKQKGKR